MPTRTSGERRGLRHAAPAPVRAQQASIKFCSNACSARTADRAQAFGSVSTGLYISSEEGMPQIEPPSPYRSFHTQTPNYTLPCYYPCHLTKRHFICCCRRTENLT